MTRLGMKLATLLLASAPVWVACSSDDPVQSTAPVAAVTVTPALDTVREGMRVTLTATTTDASGNVLTGRSVTWASNAPPVALVDTLGVVVGIGAGTATITATSEGQSGTAAVTVWTGVTGSWTGTVTAPAGVCPLDPSLTESGGGMDTITGTADLQAPCASIMLTVTGTNNTGGVPDSVELAFDAQFTFNGTFDGVDMMSGVINGAGCVDCPASFTRGSIEPLAVPAAVGREGALTGENVFLSRH